MIAGGDGFLGSHIHEILKKTNAKIYIPKITKVVDFRKRNHCKTYIKRAKPHVLINCAAVQGGIAYHEGKQADLFMENILMGLFLMKSAQEEGVEKFVNIVAGCSYPGYLEKSELNEKDYWNGKLHDSIFSYGFARKASVVFGLALEKQFHFNSIHLVLANMYGPREHFHPQQSKALAGLMKKFYDAKKQRLPSVEVWGTGNPIRDWLYVKDGAEAILRATASYNDIDPLNIASGVGVSIAQLTKIIQHIVGYKGKIFYNKTRPDGALKKTFGIRKMENVLHWMPKTPLEKGVKETFDWFSKNYDYASSH